MFSADFLCSYLYYTFEFVTSLKIRRFPHTNYEHGSLFKDKP